MRNDYERLKDILEAINKIEKYANKGKKFGSHKEVRM
jgi:uncharacterized protein with HEPN domain